MWRVTCDGEQDCKFALKAGRRLGRDALGEGVGGWGEGAACHGEG